MGLPRNATGLASFPEMYERCIVGPLFRPWADLALDEVKLAPGDRLVDIACGTGIVARVARERMGNGATVVGIDLSRDMLAVARRVAPDIDWRKGHAAALPLVADERFDVVVCQQGLQFFPDKAAAAMEMRRAVAPGGRLAVATWRPDAEIPFLRELRAVAERHVGAIADQRHSFGDGTALEALLRAAGFQDVRSRTVSLPIRFEADAQYERLNAMALVGMSAAGKSMSAQERLRAVDTIATDSASVLARYAEGKAIAFEISSNLATALG